MASPHPLAQDPSSREKRQRQANYPSSVSPRVASADNGLKGQLDRGAKRRLRYD